jgi:DNA-binding SARP family transcriptional activator/TolB-like protein
MLRLLTLGGVAIVDESGNSPGSGASQRRTLALLSVLAVAGSVGLTRDKLVGLFWPEADNERGRHALTQALYAARRGLQCDDLFIVNADVRLNDERIATDIGDFDALREIDPERAVALYRGPFLDGFFFSGSADFEQWASGQRARIEGQVSRALEGLANRARAEGDPRRAADWWKRSAAISPLDSGVALQLMETLAASGDRAGALQYAATHTKLLRNELDLDPDPAVIALTRALHEPAPAPVSELVQGPGLEAEAVRPPPSLRVESGAKISSVRDAVEVWVPQRRPRRTWRLPFALIVAAVLLALVIGVEHARRGAATLHPLPLRQRVVVAPFRVAGAASSLAYLRDGMVELLSTRLADDSAARSVDAGAVIGAWHAAGLAPAMDVSRDTVVRLASRLRAERVVIGSVVGTPKRIVVHAMVLRVPSGALAGEATVEGSADSIAAVVDQLAARLLVAEAGEDERLGNYMSTSLPALRAFLAGQAAFRGNDYTGAARQYETALTRDSTFALAGLRLAVTADRIDNAARVQRGLNVAWTYRHELAERDRAMLLTFTGSSFPAPSQARSQIDDWSRAADLAPTSAEAWFALGARLFHDGAIAAAPNHVSEARVALGHALDADTNYSAAARLLVQLPSPSGDSASDLPGARRVAFDDSLSPLAPFLRWRRAAMDGDTATLRPFRETFGRLGPTNLREIAMASQFDAIALSDGVRALDALHDRSAGHLRPVDLLLGEHSMAMNEGRIGDARQAASALRESAPGSRADLRLYVLDALYGDGDTLAARDAARSLDQGIASPSDSRRPPDTDRLADLCVVGQWRLRAGITASVPAIIGELRSASAVAGAGPAGPVSAGATACAELLDAGVSVATRSGNARGRVTALDAIAFTNETAGDAAAYAPLWIAQLHERVGDVSGALSALRRRQYMSDWPRYLATILREEGRLAERTGDAAGTRDALRRYLVLRRRPDAALQAQVDEVRQTVDRLDALEAP